MSAISLVWWRGRTAPTLVIDRSVECRHVLLARTRRIEGRGHVPASADKLYIAMTVTELSCVCNVIIRHPRLASAWEEAVLSEREGGGEETRVRTLSYRSGVCLCVTETFLTSCEYPFPCANANSVAV